MDLARNSIKLNVPAVFQLAAPKKQTNFKNQLL